MFIGIDIGGTKLAAVLADADLTVHEEARLPTPATQDELLDTLTAVVGGMAMRASVPVLGVGVGVPSMVERPGGRIAMSVNVDLEGVDLAEVLGRRTGRPVVVDNDANVAALAEHRAGAARGAATAIILTLGTGVGGGVILDGRVFHGGHGMGAELGHVLVDGHGPPCPGSCPGNGCLEAYASGTAVARAGRAAAIDHPDGPLATALRERGAEARTVTEVAEAGDPVALRVLEEAGWALGVGMAGLANIFNPEVFVLGGGMAAAGDLLLGPAEREYRRRALPPHAGARVVPAHFGPEAGVLGAALLAIAEAERHPPAGAP